MNVAELLEREFKVKTTYNINPEVDAIETTITKVLSYNPRRIGFILVNLGANFVTISPNADVSLTKGIYLVANGGTFSAVWNEDFELPTLQWFGIADTAAADLFILEVLTE